MVHLHTKFRFSSFSGLENYFPADIIGLRQRLFYNVFLYYRYLLVPVHLNNKFRFFSFGCLKNAFWRPFWIKMGDVLTFSYIIVTHSW